ncbi:DUF484 family protein [Kineobactrum salinum]|uniref:DUF484 family protein n=1 Tax=Kineobactrum salinum TaxID=2708301 RepID=A0A6C0TZQ0_9GAMM|nr:DUF484 family protein [Kineobactrum salinum]QIB65261.1 DUF484 family protein [Kineobactrum salinum]
MAARPDQLASPAAAALSDEQVREYLKHHSDFLQRHPDMLDFLHVSHSSGSAVSLVEKQVSVLRERNIEMRQRLNALTANARYNDKLYEQTRRLVLALLEADELGELCAAFHRAMAEDFEVEHASIILFGDRHSAPPGVRTDSAERARIEIGALLRSRKATCGALRREELNYLFPEAGEVGSAATMPLLNGAELGIIAVGSSDPNLYNSSMGTLFLQHIAEVLVRLIPRLSGAG